MAYGTYIPTSGTVWAWLSVSKSGTSLRVSFIVKNLKNVISQSYKILMGRPENLSITYPLLTLPCKREMGSTPVRLEDNRVERRGIERMGVAIIEDDGRTHPPIKI